MYDRSIHGETSQAVMSVGALTIGIVALSNLVRLWRLMSDRFESSIARLLAQRAGPGVQRAERAVSSCFRLYAIMVMSLFGCALAGGGLYGIFRYVEFHMHHGYH